MYGLIKKNTQQYIVFPLCDADGDFVSGATITGEFNYWEDGTAPQTSFSALTNAEVEIGSTGIYRVLLTTGETNHGYVTYKFTSGTSKPQLLEFRTMTNNPEYLATTASGALVWASATRALTDKAGFTISGTTQTFDALDTLLDSAHGAGSWATATGFSTHAAADVWTAGSRELSTPANYKADVSNLDAAITTRAPANEYDTELDATVSSRSSHAAADIWSVVTRQLSGTINDFDELDTALDSAHGAGSWLTGGAGGATIQVIPSIPKNIDLSNTKTVRIALYVIDQNDDLPTTGEITPGTIKIERSADGGTSWSTIVNDEACSEQAGGIYYDEVFDSGTGYTSADMIQITFKGQKCVIAANDHEIADGTAGMVFTTRIDSGLSGGGPSAGDIADAVWDEPIVDHTTSSQFGGKNQKVVPSETIADYKATGFSTHAAADIWSVGTREITGGALTTPNDYKATGFSTHSAANVWAVATRQLSGTISDFDELDTALDSAHGAGSWATAVGFSTHAAADVWSAGSRSLSTPNDYKADVSGLATSTALTLVQGILLQNGVLEFTTYDINDNMTDGKLYVYDTKANATTNNHSTGLLAEFTMDATFDGSDRPTLRRWVIEP